jgi:hypothetical protein
VPANCAAIRATAGPIVGAPSGGLSGTLTLINVNSGLDFTLDATALENLSTRAFFRPPGDPYPDWTALEIDPVSVVVANGAVYRSHWTRPVDAISAVLMRESWMGEYVLDPETRSATDMVVTMPTRHHYANTATASPPFSAPIGWKSDCGTTSSQAGEPIGIVFFNREEQGAVDGEANFPTPPPNSPSRNVCAASAVASVGPDRPPSLLGSTTLGLAGGGTVRTNTLFRNGWLVMSHIGRTNGLGSLASSTSTNILTGQVTTGVHAYRGLPMVGFFARTFANGTLACGAGACQGNYGGAFPMRSLSTISSP